MHETGKAYCDASFNVWKKGKAIHDSPASMRLSHPSDHLGICDALNIGLHRTLIVLGIARGILIVSLTSHRVMIYTAIVLTTYNN